MKKAVCLYGSVIQEENISPDSRIGAIKQCYGQDVDIFIHSDKELNWSRIEGVVSADFDSLEEAKSRSGVFLSNSRDIILDLKTAEGIANLYYKWASVKRSLDSLKNSGREYECVVCIDINNIMMRRFFSEEKFDKVKDQVCFPIWNMNQYRCAFLDLLWISNQENAMKISSLYEELDKYLFNGSDFEKHLIGMKFVAPQVQSHKSHKFSNQTLLRWHAVNTFGNKISFWGLKGIDYDLTFAVGRNDTGFDRPVQIDTTVPIGFEEGQRYLCGPVGI